MTYGLVQASGVIYAQLGETKRVASYLLALRIVQVISTFSQAPFYTKLPQLAMLLSQGKHRQQQVIARRGMTLSYWAYAVAFVAMTLFADPVLTLIGSNTNFVEPELWAILGLAFFIERYGAMHLNLYGTTNHIVNHIANGVTGVIFILFSWLLYERLEVLAFPVALLAGFLGFYTWYSAMHSYRMFNIPIWQFEKITVLPPLCVMLLFSAWSLS